MFRQLLRKIYLKNRLHQQSMGECQALAFARCYIKWQSSTFNYFLYSASSLNKMVILKIQI